MNKIMKKIPLLVSLFFIPTGMVLADNMKMYGTLLIPPPCTIHDDGIIEIVYKDIGLHKIDGINYAQPIDYGLKCDSNMHSWDLMLSIKGPKTGFDDSALQTNIRDLGMRITQNGQGFELNKPIKINYGQPPILEVVPVKRPGSTLPEGAFSVTATLLAEYQ